MRLKFRRLGPDKAYVGTTLFLPRRHILEEPVFSALTFGLDDGDETDDIRVLVKEHPHHLEVPRAFLTAKQLAELGIELVDQRPTEFRSIRIAPKPGFSLRERQAPAWEMLKKSGSGILNLACGSGKTILGLYAVSQKKVPALIVAPQAAHLESWLHELRENFDFDGTVGWVRGKKMEYGADIVLATVSTLANRARDGGLPPDFSTTFGLTIYDETHVMAANHFARSAAVSAGPRLGLTATVERTDGLEGVFLNNIGPVLYKDLTQEMDPEFIVHDTGTVLTEEEYEETLATTGEPHIGLLRKVLANNMPRNELIVAQIREDLAAGRIVYAATHNPEHAEFLSEWYFPGVSTFINGKVIGAKERLRRLHEHSLTFITIGVGREALNRTDLDMLHILTPFSTKDRKVGPALQQLTGRIQRDLDGKPTPLVRIWKDEHIGECTGMVWKLVNYAKAQGWNVTWKDSKPRRQRQGW